MLIQYAYLFYDINQDTFASYLNKVIIILVGNGYVTIVVNVKMLLIIMNNNLKLNSSVLEDASKRYM